MKKPILPAQADEKPDRLQRALQVISECNQAMVRSTSEQNLLANICRIVVKAGGYRMAWVGFAEHDSFKTVRSIAHAGFEEGYVANVSISWADCEEGRGPAGTAIRSGKPCVCRDTQTDQCFGPWRTAALARGYASCICLPLMKDGRAFGSLNIYSGVAGDFAEDEVRLLTEMASDLSYGIGVLRVRNELKEAQVELQRQHDHLEELVKQRTAEVIGANELLRKSEEEYRTLIQNVNVGVSRNSPDPRGGFMQVNPALAQIFGYESIEELLAVKISDLYADPSYRQHYLADIAKEGFVKNRLLHMRKKDGTLIWCSVTARAHHNADGSIAWIDGIMEDITERKRTEEAIAAQQEMLLKLTNELARSEERERRRIAVLLHDRVGQTLAITQMKLQLLNGDPAAEQPLVTEALALVEQAITDTRSLTSQLCPPVLYELGLEAAIEWLAEEVHREQGLEVIVHKDGSPKPLSQELSSLLFQAVRELLVNVTKHAKAGRVTVEMVSNGRNLNITVGDDGVGFADGDGLTRSKADSFGLFNIRHRLTFHAGQLRVQSSPGQGARVTLMVPVLPKM